MSAYAKILVEVHVAFSGLADKETVAASGDIDQCCEILNAHAAESLGLSLRLAVVDRIIAVSKGDIEVNTVDDVRRYIDLKCLSQCAPLISDSNDIALAVHRKERCQREHMLGDDISLDIVKSEVPVSIPHGNTGVGKSVDSSARNILVVPVVKKIIVKERASYKAVSVHFDLKCSLKEMCEKKAVLGNCKAMLENSCLTMLNKCLHHLSFRTQDDILAAAEKFLREPIFSYAFCKM